MWTKAQQPVAFTSIPVPPAKEDTSVDNQKEPESFDEVPVTLNVARIGSLEIQALIAGQQLYLPVNELFDFLKIKNKVSPEFDRIEGFFIIPKDNYVISKADNRIIYQEKIFDLGGRGLWQTPDNLYLRSDYFGKVFGLECQFDFRNLSVTLNTKIELPAILEMQQDLMRRNLSRLKGENKPDTSIARTFKLFHVGMADWAVTSSQESQNPGYTRAMLGIGAVVAGGELDLSLNYNSQQKVDLRQQLYQWRLVNNDNAFLRQVTAGKIYTQSISTLYAPVTGIQLTNTPTTYRRSFGTYTISNTTEPGWMVELYVNNVLVNYVKADASGFYSFEVPMVYGNSVVKLRFYGPWGEERTSEKFISIPFNFLPAGKLEYSVTAGVVDDDQKSFFSRAVVNYGLNKRTTIGAGTEFLSSVSTGKAMPFVTASYRISQFLLLSGEHTMGVRTKGSLNFRLPSNLQVDLNYTKYDKHQTAIKFNYLDEKNAVVSMPFRVKSFNAFSRLSFNQFTMPYGTVSKGITRYTSAEFLLSAVVAGISTNLTSNAIYSIPGNALWYSTLSFTVHLPYGLRITPLAQYEYTQQHLSKLRAEVEKSIFYRGFINLSYEKSFVNQGVGLATIGFRYNFSLAQTFFSSSRRNNDVITTQSARGSLIYDARTRYLGGSYQPAVGKGGIIILPFLDFNCNGRRDPGEPGVAGLKLHVKGGGSIQQHGGDTTIRITGLESYTNYFIEVDKNSFDNVAWQIKNPNIGVAIDPNLLKPVEIPVAVVGEASGRVFIDCISGRNGLGRIIVDIYNTEGLLVGKTLSESDGYFSYMGLTPGNYVVKIDAAQLQKLSMQASPAIPFIIKAKKEGDVADGMNFDLTGQLPR